MVPGAEAAEDTRVAPYHLFPFQSFPCFLLVFAYSCLDDQWLIRLVAGSDPSLYSVTMLLSFSSAYDQDNDVEEVAVVDSIQLLFLAVEVAVVEDSIQLLFLAEAGDSMWSSVHVDTNNFDSHSCSAEAQVHQLEGP